MTFIISIGMFIFGFLTFKFLNFVGEYNEQNRHTVKWDLQSVRFNNLLCYFICVCLFKYSLLIDPFLFFCGFVLFILIQNEQ